MLDIREIALLVPGENPYLFALAGSLDRWIDAASALRKYAKSCGVKYPERLMLSRLRKQIATTLQILKLSDIKMEQVTTFMGHTKKSPEEFNR